MYNYTKQYDKTELVSLIKEAGNSLSTSFIYEPKLESIWETLSANTQYQTNYPDIMDEASQLISGISKEAITSNFLE